MRKIEIEICKTNELSDKAIKTINDLKNQHWKHTDEEHMMWFKKNIRQDDKHLLMWGRYSLLAYLNLVHIDVEINKRPYRMFGIGNVCVSKDKEHIGIGTILMSAANAFLKESKSCGLLLCHNDTMNFYGNCGWKKLVSGVSFVDGKLYEHYTMFYDPCNSVPKEIEQLMINRSF